MAFAAEVYAIFSQERFQWTLLTNGNLLSLHEGCSHTGTRGLGGLLSTVRQDEQAGPHRMYVLLEFLCLFVRVLFAHTTTNKSKQHKSSQQKVGENGQKINSVTPGVSVPVQMFLMGLSRAPIWLRTEIEGQYVGVVISNSFILAHGSVAMCFLAQKLSFVHLVHQECLKQFELTKANG